MRCGVSASIVPPDVDTLRSNPVHCTRALHAGANIVCRQGLMMAKQQNLTRAIGNCRGLRTSPLVSRRSRTHLIAVDKCLRTHAGVSNYKVKDLEALKGDVPSVNQCLMSVSLVRYQPVAVSLARCCSDGHLANCSTTTRLLSTVKSKTSSMKHMRRCALAPSKIRRRWRLRKATMHLWHKCVCDGSCKRAVSWR